MGGNARILHTHTPGYQRTIEGTCPTALILLHVLSHALALLVVALVRVLARSATNLLSSAHEQIPFAPTYPMAA